MSKSRRQAVDRRHDIAATGNRELPTWTEVILDVYDQQNIALADGDSLSHALDLFLIGMALEARCG